jgi:hypothetical protein
MAWPLTDKLYRFFVEGSNRFTLLLSAYAPERSHIAVSCLGYYAVDTSFFSADHGGILDAQAYGNSQAITSFSKDSVGAASTK